MALSILTVGENPHLSFYAWRLHSTKACSVTVVSASLDLSAPLQWQSKQLGNTTFSPDFQAHSLSQLEPSSKYDVVILSVSNLQAFQDLCAGLAPFLHSSSLVVVESTGYVSLEPFVISSYPKQKKLTVCSIMNEADVKSYPRRNEFSHAVLNQDQRIYFGSCMDESKTSAKVRDSETYAKFYKLLQKVQEQSGGHVSLLKSNNHKEFMTYQWKLALPRIVLNPLSVIFEEPYPANLDKQILAKPLISGLVNEIFKIIKKMECKLIKGFENESNIMKNWSAHFPAMQKQAVPVFSNSNPVFYNFYHQIDIDVDLLLLQPILLGDDHGVRTPYLENLYSIVCQLLKMNTAESMFFTRKSAASDKHVRELGSLSNDLVALKLERDNVESQYRERQTHMQQLEKTLSQRQQAQDSLVRKFEEQSRLYDSKISELERYQQQKEAALADLDGHLQHKQSALKSLETRLLQAESAWSNQQNQQKQQQQNQQVQQQQNQQNSQQKSNPGTSGSDAPSSTTGSQKAETSNTYQYSEMQTPDLSDLSEMAIYGAELNGDMITPTPQVPPVPQAPQNSVSEAAQARAPTQLAEKEKELQRREQALMERERELRGSSKAPMQQNEPYYDPQTGEQFHDVASGYPQQPGFQPNGPQNGPQGGPQNGTYNGAAIPNGGAQSQNYRPSYSLSGPNTYSQQYEAISYDQRPPHGLPPNGFPQNSLPPTLRNPQRYQQNGAQFNQQPSQRPRVTSHSSGPASMNYGSSSQQGISSHGGAPQNMQHRANNMALHQQMQMNQHAPMQSSGSQQYLLNQASHSAPQGFPAKKGNRRSAFPDQALNIDYGGRGGMPMPTATGGKHKSVMMGGPGASSSPPIPQVKKSYSGVNVAGQSQGAGHLRIPNQPMSSNSDSLGSHGSMTEDSPKPSTPDSSKDIRLEVPGSEVAGKPLGGIAPPPEEKKKKRGFLKKH